MKEKIIGIYKITNKINGKYYIGQSNNIENREIKHFKTLRKNIHFNNYLQNEFNLFGEQNFKINVIFLCQLEDLDKCEKIWIKLLDAQNREKGYNFSEGGNAFMRNRKHTPEAKIKMSLALLGNKRCLGHKATEETKAKMSAAHLGRKRKPFSEETKAKMRAKHISGETRAKMSMAKIGNKNRLGYKASEETKSKIGIAKIGNKNSLGRKHTDIEIMKMKQAWIKRKQNKAKEGNNTNAKEK
jgi:group I intron endonuclease